MKSFILLAILATAVAAQTTASGSGSSCAADYILETCLNTENAAVAACGTTDYVCQCNAYGALVTCFNNCPNDSRVGTYKGQQQIFCGYATQFTSSTAKANAVTATGSLAASTTAASATASSSSTGTASSSASAATKTNSAADLVLNAGSVLAGVAGVIVAVL